MSSNNPPRFTRPKSGKQLASQLREKYEADRAREKAEKEEKDRALEAEAVKKAQRAARLKELGDSRAYEKQYTDDEREKANGGAGPWHEPNGNAYKRERSGFKSKSEPPPPDPSDEIKDLTADLDGMALPPSEGVPAHVWPLLQQAGEAAAMRLVAIIRSASFMRMAPTAQKSFIELALTRAYGLPIKKAIQVNLSSKDSDAVSASLNALIGDLPEFRPSASNRDDIPEAEVVPSEGEL